MLYTVHTNFTARDKETGFIRRYSKTDKIEAPDKDTAKMSAWLKIQNDKNNEFVTFEGSNARLSNRK